MVFLRETHPTPAAHEKFLPRAVSRALAASLSSPLFASAARLSIKPTGGNPAATVGVSSEAYSVPTPRVCLWGSGEERLEL